MKITLQILQDHPSYTKFSKCEFWLLKVKLLSHVVFNQGIYADPTMMEPVTDREQPKMVFNIRSFLRQAGYYRRFIQDFSKIAALMTQLTQKGVIFVRTDKCETSFQELKKWLTSALILIILERGLGYEFYCDASGDKLGCVLMQQGQVVAFKSQQLKTHKLNYLTRELELAMVVHALKTKRHYLYEDKFEVLSDQKILTYIFTQRELNARQDAGWSVLQITASPCNIIQARRTSWQTY